MTPKQAAKIVYKRRDVVMALKLSQGNITAAAEALGMDEKSLRRRITNDPQLFALYGAQSQDAEVPEKNQVNTMVRTPDQIPMKMEENRALAEELMKQDRELLRSGLLAAGISPATIAKIRSLDGMARNTAAFLSVSIDFTHRLNIFAQASLAEELIYIRENHLRSEKMDPMVKVMWQRAYNEIAEMLGKGHDRALNATQAMMAIAKGTQGDNPNGGGKPAKPAWQQAKPANAAPAPKTPAPA